MPDGGELHMQSEYRLAFHGLRRFFAGRGVPAEEAADLAQEALTRTFVHIKRHGRASEDLWPLLTTVARNLYSDRGRRTMPATVSLSEAVELVDSDPTPDDVVLRRERRAAVRAAVASLPARHRRAIELELGGMTPADIAHELGIKRNAADALLHRARRSLASKLESMRGAFAGLPLVLRVRAFARRASETISRVDPTTGFASAATGIAAVAIAAALGGTPHAHHAPTAPGSVVAARATTTAPVHVTTNTSSAAPVHRAASSTSTDSARLVTTRVEQEKVGAHVRAANPTNSEDNDVGIEIWQQPDGRRSIIGDAIDHASAGACWSDGCGSGR